MKLERIETPGIAHYAYLIADGPEAALVDPRRDVDDYLEAARKLGVRISHVFETHRQEDFEMGSRELARRTGAKVVNLDHELFGHGDLRTKDGDEVRVGGLRFRVLHTPGHTPESTCYALFTGEASAPPWAVLTGDTLFFGDTGRTDLTDEDAAEENAGRLFDSVHEKLADLGDTVLVLPAHGPGSVCGSGMEDRPWSTLGQEKRTNDVFTMGRESFAKKKGGERMPRPPYFRHMEEVNLEGGRPPVLRPGDVPLLPVPVFAERSKNACVLDTREPEAFAGGHAPGSHSIWLGGLPAFGGWIANGADAILLLTDRETDVDTATLHLGRIGIDGVQGALAGGFGSWRTSGEAIRTAGVITPAELHENREAFVVLDVREPDEFASGHIEGAINVYAGELADHLDELPRKRPLAVTCGVGHRAGVGVGILQRAGFEDVRNLLGGMKAWKTLGLPTD